MPYISKNLQEKVDPQIDKLFELFAFHGMNLGEGQEPKINYGLLEYIVFRFIQKIAILPEYQKFEFLNGLVGVLETTKLEFIRRILGPKEDLKLIENWKDE